MVHCLGQNIYMEYNYGTLDKYKKDTAQGFHKVAMPVSKSNRNMGTKRGEVQIL